ncbi:MAG: hypothetical protein M4579_002597 [Chaenotheca gracillima]|nr:MAG: hypothetical protein M4579_002597 [Chaenotheca gracillima]
MVYCRQFVLAVTLSLAACIAAQSSTTSSASAATTSPTSSPTTNSQTSVPGLATTSALASTSDTLALSSSTSSSSSLSSSATSTSTSTGAALTAASKSSPTSTRAPPPSPDNKRRNLIIILSVVVSVTALGLIGCTIFFIRQYCTSRSSLLRRNTVTPIDDEEIASWRANGFEKGDTKQEMTEQPENTVDAPDWSERPLSAPQAPAPAAINVTRPPNSRSGLTDSSVPGAAPFIPPPRRNSSKLQKSTSRRHVSAHSSRHSSISGRPLTPYSPSSLPDGEGTQRYGNETYPKMEPRASGSRELHRGYSADHPPSSRPRSQSFDFGFPSHDQTIH